MEASLKLKEISYIQCEGFAAGELKHGTIALIEDGTPVLALLSDPVLANHTRGNIQEVAAVVPRSSPSQKKMLPKIQTISSLRPYTLTSHQSQWSYQRNWSLTL